MDRRNFLAAGAVAAVAATGSTAAMAAPAGNDNDIVGSWFGTVTATNPPLGSFNELISFLDGGVVIESRRYSVPNTPFGTLLETTGHGAWKKTGGHTYEAFFRFLIQNQDTGAPIGTDNIRLVLTLGNGALTGTFQSQIKDLGDNVIFMASGDYSATPVTV
jgi:hypothetical protein